jgi:hypothetical protein
VLINLWMFEFVLVLLVGVWLIYQRPSATIVPFGSTSAQASRSDGTGKDGSEDETGAIEPQGAATGAIRQSSRPSPVAGSKSGG